MDNSGSKYDSVPPKPKMKKLFALNVLVIVGIIVTGVLVVNMIIIAFEF